MLLINVLIMVLMHHQSPLSSSSVRYKKTHYSCVTYRLFNLTLLLKLLLIYLTIKLLLFTNDRQEFYSYTLQSQVMTVLKVVVVGGMERFCEKHKYTLKFG